MRADRLHAAPHATPVHPPERLTIFVPHASDLLTDHRPHGDGLVAWGVIDELARRGHVLHVAVERVDIRRPIPSNVHLHPIATPSPASWAGRIRYILRVGQLFRRLRRRENLAIDVIHQLNPVTRGMSLSLLGSGQPIVLGAYSSPWPQDVARVGASRSLARRLGRAGARAISALQEWRADALLITTPAAVDSICWRRSIGAKTFVFPHAVDAEEFAPAPSGRGPDRRPSILFLGRVQARKGIDTLLDAFEIVGSQLSTCRLIVGGTGADLARVRERAARMRCARRVEFLGEVDRRAVPALIRGSTVCCLPSHGEPYGMAILEAMACARPVVSTDTGGPAHLVPDGGGFRVPAGDPRALADALLRVLRSPELQDRMGRENRRIVEARYTRERAGERLERIYRDVIARRRRCARRG